MTGKDLRSAAIGLAFGFSFGVMLFGIPLSVLAVGILLPSMIWWLAIRYLAYARRK